MKKLCFATGNKNKLAEIQQLLEGQFQVLSFEDIGFDEEIEETGTTLPENAQIKARTIHERFGLDVFADDTGLEVDALNGAPGVYSARYAGENCSYQDNVDKLLREMRNAENRNARFKTSICLILEDQEYFFDGIVDGTITTSASGNEGFGYDPVFKPVGYEQTFAEMEASQKNEISHRGRAIRKLADFLSNR